MKNFVVDNSVVLSWIFEDEHSGKSEAILNALSEAQAFVPCLWPYELANALYIAEKKRRIKEADSQLFIRNLQNLPIVVENNSYENVTKDVLSISREHKITVYDASYIDLAVRKNVNIASFDEEIITVCTRMGVAVYS